MINRSVFALRVKLLVKAIQHVAIPDFTDKFSTFNSTEKIKQNITSTERFINRKLAFFEMENFLQKRKKERKIYLLFLELAIFPGKNSKFSTFTKSLAFRSVGSKCRYFKKIIVILSVAISLSQPEREKKKVFFKKKLFFF